MVTASDRCGEKELNRNTKLLIAFPLSMFLRSSMVIDLGHDGKDKIADCRIRDGVRSSVTQEEFVVELLLLTAEEAQAPLPEPSSPSLEGMSRLQFFEPRFL